MLRYRKWVLTLGLVAAAPLAATPAQCRAGLFDGNRPQAEAQTAAFNQQVAEQVAGKLRAARLKGADIEIEFQGGTLTLKGQVADQGAKAMASQLGASVNGVTNVNNQMTVAPASGGAIQQAGMTAPAGTRPAGAIRQTSGDSPFGQPAGVQAADFEATTAAAPMIQPVAAAKQQSRRTAAAPQRTAALPTSMPAAAPQMPPAPPAPAAANGSNQQTAEQVANALAQAGLSGYDIEVRCQNGTCTLGGVVTNPQAIDAAYRAAASVPGLTSIQNSLTLAAPPAGVMPTAYQPGMEGTPAPAMGYGYPPGYGPQTGYPPGYGPAPAAGMPPAYGPNPGYGAPPAMGVAGPGAASPVYEQPNLPEYAWPSYAQSPNYSAVTYPSQYSASAWPYIGPFYPYPQVPLGWRKATLEWDDGQWYLDFNDRTDKWWWFMNPKNW